MNKGLKYGAGLIALYLIVKNGRNFSTAITGGAKGASTLVTSLQGR